MKLLYFSITAPVGGHLRSLVTIAEEMRARGNDVQIITTNGPGVEIIKRSAIGYFVLPNMALSAGNFNWRNFLPLYRIIKLYKPHVVQTFLGGLPQLTIICRLLKIKFVSTICGGKIPAAYPTMSPITVFSKELKQGLVSLFNRPDWIYIIPGRMSEVKAANQSDLSGYLEKIGVPQDAYPIVMMICRKDKRKSEALDKYFNAAKLFGAYFRKGFFVHIGSGNDVDYQNVIADRVEAINAESNRIVLISTVDGSDDPAKFLELADYVVGMGRSAFEGMSIGKPTLILSNEGYGGIVQPEHIDKLADYNFTGRGNQFDSKKDHLRLAEDLIKLEADPSFSKSSAEFGYKWYKQNLDVKTAAILYEKIYEMEFGNYQPMSTFEIVKFIIRELLRQLWYAARK
jgi:hypothetical protein